MSQEVGDMATAGGNRRYVLWGGLALIVIVVAGVFWWASADRALILEEELTAELDAILSRADDSWCLGGCSGTGHEWHSQGALIDVAELVAESARSIGAETSIESGDPGTMLVLIDRGSAAVVVAVTDSTWANAALDGPGVAVWFTSVRVFDQGAYR